jgi:hypothetical protein
MAYGAAISCLVTQVYMAAGQIIIAFILLRLRMPAGFLLRLLLSIPLIMAGGYLSTRYFENWYLGIALLSGWTGIVTFSLRLVRMGDFRKLLPETGE